MSRCNTRKKAVDPAFEREVFLTLGGTKHVYAEFRTGGPAGWFTTVCVICGVVGASPNTGEGSNERRYPTCGDFLTAPEASRHNTGVGPWDEVNPTWKPVWERLRREYGHG